MADAHDLTGTVISLELGQRSHLVELQAPLKMLTEASASTDLRTYVLEHLRLTAADGRVWSGVIDEVVTRREDDVELWVGKGRWAPPPGADVRVFDLFCDVIQHEVVGHSIYVDVRTDFQNAVVGGKPQLLAVLGFQGNTVHLDRRGGSAWRGFQAAFWFGVGHIAEGADHLLFLFMLLLPAPLMASRRRWVPNAPIRPAVLKVVKVVTAFTLGHSATLALATVFRFQPSARVVESLIAVSVLVSALHAMRPLFANKEPLVAGLFGLTHGLAFASVLVGLGVEGAALALSLLAFNLGVEAMQLVAVAVTMPSLVALRQGLLFVVIRWVGASFGAVAALAWLIERAGETSNPLAPMIEGMVAKAPWGAAALGVLALTSRAIRARLYDGPGA